jgi:hypothetical protein
MSKINLKNSSQKSFVMSDVESLKLKKLLSNSKQKIIDSIENSEELSLSNILNSIGCDKEVEEAILVIY